MPNNKAWTGYMIMTMYLANITFAFSMPVPHHLVAQARKKIG
jgi:hypothetical protein